MVIYIDSRVAKTVACFYSVLILALISGCARKSLTGPHDHKSIMQANPYVFGWLDYPIETKPIRDGMTKGTPVTLDTLPSPAWMKLRYRDNTQMDRDQAAIRALAGDYRVSFDFLETLVFGSYGGPSRPYRSWGTERIYLIEDRPGFIELQHILVMFFVDEDTSIEGPFVMKHWRQRWEFEPERMHSYTGHRIWENRDISEERRKGSWVQTVYQVDDTPRYALMGKWQHFVTHSQWASEVGYRPLPRREYSVRDDYHVLEGTNRITVLQDGWAHEQDNLKCILSDENGLLGENRHVAREIGMNRYQRITGFDFSAGDDYWQETAAYWKLVRGQLDSRVRASDRMRVDTKCDGNVAFMIFFEQAAAYRANQDPQFRTIREGIDTLLDCLVSTADVN